MADHYVKTEAGRREIRERAISLTRSGRNLLFIIDATKSGSDWLKLVQGSAGNDLAQLIEAGLVALQSAGARATGTNASTTASTSARTTSGVAAGSTGPLAAASSAGPSLAQVLDTLSYQQLYDLITSQARPRLGLIKGYKMILEVERCNGPAEIRALTARFVDLVRDVQGESEAQVLRRILGAPS